MELKYSINIIKEIGLKIKLKDDIDVDKLFLDNNAKISKNKEYEVTTILYVKWDNSNKSYYILYYIVNDNYQIVAVNEEDFMITDSSIDNDFIYVEQKLLQRYSSPEELITTYALYPKSIDLYYFYDVLENTELVQLNQSFCKRFKHLLPEYKYAECFKENYQDPNLKIEAEPIGENFVLCPECNEIFEVKKDEGVITCPNIACRAKLNNPYAPKFPKKE